MAVIILSVLWSRMRTSFGSGLRTRAGVPTHRRSAGCWREPTKMATPASECLREDTAILCSLDP